jgi:7-cyano-7-deazaguanine synthase in queuosine biosynthesis
MKFKTLITLSGGLDSTFVLYQHLKDNPYDPTLVMHINLRHSAEDRLTKEQESCNNIVKELRKMGMRNFEYIQFPIFDYGELQRITIKDIQIVAMFKAIVLKSPQYETITKIKFGWHKGEVNREDINKGYRVRKMFEALELDRDIDFIFPIENMTRAELWKQLPARLKAHVSSCRKPKANGKPCYSCKTCFEYLAENLNPI